MGWVLDDIKKLLFVEGIIALLLFLKSLLKMHGKHEILFLH